MSVTRREFLAGVGCVALTPFLGWEPTPTPDPVLQRQPVVPLISPIPGNYCMNVRVFPGMDKCNIEVTRYDPGLDQSVPIWLGTGSREIMFEDALEFIDKFRSHSKIYVYVMGRINTYEFIQQASSRGGNVFVAWHV